MNPYITTKKQKQPNKNNRNHYVRWVMVTILFILIALFFTGCSQVDDRYLKDGMLQVNEGDSIPIDRPSSSYSEVRFLYNQRYNQPKVDNPIFVESATNGAVTTTQFNVSDLGLSADKIITITFTQQ